MNLLRSWPDVQPRIPGVSKLSSIRYCDAMTVNPVAALGPRRPRGVTVIGVVVYIGGIIDIIGGSMLLVLATGAALLANPVPGGILTAITVIIAGIIVVAVADGLMRGSAVARLIVTVVRGVSIIMHAIALTSGGVALLVGIVSLLISAIVLSWLWTPSARAYFTPPVKIPPGV